MIRKCLSLCCLILLPGLLSGCASFSRGITEAILDRDSEDTRQCWITGREFAGLDSLFEGEADGDADTGSPALLKVLKVHGIGLHQPGYSQPLLNGLVAELGFVSMDETIKTINLNLPLFPDGLGILRVHRYMDLESSREMLYYELTWDSIVEREIRLLDFDNSAEASARRTDFNHGLKTFLNASLPDALLYNTEYRQPIQRSVGQAICWMMTERWDSLPINGDASCDIDIGDDWSEFEASSIAIVSHSLGSRISIDALQTAVSLMSQRPNARYIFEKAQAKPIYIYLMSNQLPLLQLGQPLPEVHDQVQSYCSLEGDHYDERFFESLQIVAFSDPNDLFSYAVGPDYINRYVDSRLCPKVTNVLIEVASTKNFFGQEIANPLVAHTGYDEDSRVLKMLVSGYGKSHGQDEVKERCEFIEAIPGY
jgi:hypothetical protein